MNCLFFPALFLAFLTVSCGHSPSRVSSLASPTPLFAPPLSGEASGSEKVVPKSPGIAAESESGNLDGLKSLHDPEQGAKKETFAIAAPPDLSTIFPQIAAVSGDESPRSRENLQDEEEWGEEEEATIYDPLEPFNRAMFHFNDKLYFWALKPVAQGYNWVVPEKARVSVKNFFSNLAFPVRFISCILQADFKGAAAEFGRFTVNTIWGVGGLLDPSSSGQLNLPKGDADLGETLGVYGLGQGFYLVWPVLGPSSARDSVGIVGDFFLYPVSYIRPWPAWLGVRTYEEVNDASLRIGDYESLKQAAIDPYLALRDAYRQYRQKKVEARKGQPEPLKPGGVR
jgi:phospholipid-binding lipoprotein MlaA